jgi:hypothetical protein
MAVPGSTERDNESRGQELAYHGKASESIICQKDGHYEMNYWKVI